VRKHSARYHNETDERRRDVGMHFQKAKVVLSDNFRYFGKSGKNDYKQKYPKIRRLIEALKQGHRVNHRGMKIGPPTDSDRSKLCNSDTPSVRCG
jgi:hypothetical protein